MKRYKLNELRWQDGGHFLSGIIPGKYLCVGGLTFKRPGERTHSNDGPGGIDRHVHDDDREVFIILQGKARMEIDGAFYPLTTGDVCVVEPGEDHHLISDAEEPCVSIWLHAADHRHQNQIAEK